MRRIRRLLRKSAETVSRQEVEDTNVKVSLFKNFVSLVGAEAFTKVITFGAFAYLARICGPAGFGYIEWSAAILMCASLVVDQGFSSYGAREIAKNPDDTGRLVAEIVSARFLLAAASFIAIVAFAFTFVRDESVLKLVLAYGLSLWTLPFLLQWVFQGHDRMKVVAIAQILRQTAFVAVVITMVRRADDLVFVGVAEVAGVTIAAVFTVWMYRKYLAGKILFRPLLSRRLFFEGAPIGMSQAFWVVRMFGATLILGLVATADDTGYFAGAMRIFIALHTFVWLYYFNILPSLSRAWVEGRDQFTALIQRSMRIVVLACIGVGVLWTLAAPWMMATAYGESFSNGSGALQWLAGAWISAAISGHYRFGLVAAGRQKKEMLTSAFGAIIVAVLIPLGYMRSGPSGAAAGVFAAEFVVLLSTWIIARRSLFGSHTARDQTNGRLFERAAETSR